MTNKNGLLKVTLKASELGLDDPTSLVRDVQMCKFVVIKGGLVEAYIDKSEFVKQVALLTGREPTEEMLAMIAEFLFSGNT
ncbi:hypothetical protein H6F88_31635 [Oculatella sp. FACHB-28]|uniref:hypothetical protein n=1 Tax=Oculatella sp. FACHB-28 TaxID=2692845 RepID=UPI001686C2D4|nr:hypothetical protein [Oculatella sp. FACHB-28]MBD2060495.1 hypothetical protein [Oculatella sp. FACHB-28]